MTTNRPDVVMTLLGGEQLVRLSDYEALATECEKLRAEYEEELFQVRQDRDTHFGELMRAIEQVDAMKAECERLRKELELWSPIHIEVERRAEKMHCLQDRCDFEVTVFYEDYAAIDAAMQGDRL